MSLPAAYDPETTAADMALEIQEACAWRYGVNGEMGPVDAVAWAREALRLGHDAAWAISWAAAGNQRPMSWLAHVHGPREVRRG